MNKEYLARLSEAERARVRSVLRESRPNAPNVQLLFRDRPVSVIHETVSKTILGGYDSSVLPSVGLFYDHVLLEICQFIAVTERFLLVRGRQRGQ